MTVKKLLELLKTHDPNHLVVLSKDAGGNGFSPLADDSPPHIYVPQTTWYGEVYCPEDIEDDPSRRGLVKEGKAEWCVILWPTN